MITSLLPPGIVGADAYEDRWETALLPEELPLVARAVEKRRREFAAGRGCARRVLAKLGWPGFAILSGEAREPIWPPGILGSITHCPGYCAAAATRDCQPDGLRGVGIDAEVNRPLPDGVLGLTCTARERARLVGIPGVSVPTLVFSAKESVYKAWYPVARRWLGYLDAEIEFDVAACRFEGRLLPSADVEGLPGPITFAGRFAATPRHVFTVVTATV